MVIIFSCIIIDGLLNATDFHRFRRNHPRPPTQESQDLRQRCLDTPTVKGGKIKRERGLYVQSAS